MLHHYLKLSVFAYVILLSQLAFADLNDILNASCRIVTQDRHTGTGVVYDQDEDRLLILTAGHVAVNKQNKVQTSAKVEFFGTGKRSGQLEAKIIWHKYQRNTVTDLAIIAVQKSLFVDYPIPKPMRLAKEDHLIQDGQTVISCGSPEGIWPCLWRGHIDAFQEWSMRFQPRPAGGRSGSAVFDEQGDTIIGIIIWKDPKYDQGVAISPKTIYTITGWNKVKK